MKSSPKTILFTSLIVIIVFICLLFIPPSLPSVEHGSLTTEYESAVNQINNTINSDTSKLAKGCNSILNTHGTKTSKVIVFLHGYTSCPGQFKELGDVFFENGYNVYIPRAPYHGLNDKLTHELDKLETKQYTEYAQSAIESAHGLGEEMTVVGISGGGVLTTWLALNNNTIDKVVLISPAYGLQAIPSLLTIPAINVFSILPSQYRWYDPVEKDSSLSPNNYPGYTTKSLVKVIGLGQNVSKQILKDGPQVKNVILIQNANDDTVSMQIINELQNSLEARKDIKFINYTFPASQNLGHDLIDPNFNVESKTSTYEQIYNLVSSE